MATCNHTGAYPKAITQHSMLDRMGRTSEVIRDVRREKGKGCKYGPTKDPLLSRYDDRRKTVRQDGRASYPKLELEWFESSANGDKASWNAFD